MMTIYKGYTFEYHHKFKKEFNKILIKHQCPTLKSDFKLLYDIFVEIYKKNKKEIPDKERINELFKKEINISNELYPNEENYLNQNL